MDQLFENEILNNLFTIYFDNTNEFLQKTLFCFFNSLPLVSFVVYEMKMQNELLYIELLNYQKWWYTEIYIKIYVSAKISKKI